MIKKILIATIILVLFATDSDSAIKTFTGPGNFSDRFRWNGNTLPIQYDDLIITGSCVFDDPNYFFYKQITLNNASLSFLWIYNLRFGEMNYIGNVSVDMSNGGIMTVIKSINLPQNSFIPGIGQIILTTGVHNLPAGISSYNDLTLIDNYKNLNSSITVNGNLYLAGVSCILYLNSHELKMGTSAIFTGIDNNHFIETSTGKLTQYVDSNEVLFPVGESNLYPTLYSPVKIKNTGIPDWFSVTFNKGFINSPIPLNAVNREWFISDSIPGGSDVSLNFTWDDRYEDSTFNKNSRLVIGRYNGSEWIETNSSNAAGNNPYTTTASGFQTFNSSFCVKNKSKISYNVTAIPEGYYNTVSNRLNRNDTLTTYLREINSPYNLVDSSKGILDSINFSVKDTFYNAHSGNYYLVLKHRNGLETWSKSGGESITLNSSYTYDFTSASVNAYGNNLILKGSKYCFYSGDVNNDGTIDLTDLGIIDNDVPSFPTGYIITDLNGDGAVDISDLSIADNNSTNFVSVKSPVFIDLKLKNMILSK